MSTTEDRDSQPAESLLDMSSAMQMALAAAEEHSRDKHGEATLSSLDDASADDEGSDDLFADMEDDAGIDDRRDAGSPPPDAAAAAEAAAFDDPEEAAEAEAARVLKQAAERVRSMAAGGELSLLRNQVKHLRGRLKDEDGRATNAERQLGIAIKDLKATRKRFGLVAEREDELNNRIERLKVELPQKTRTELFGALLPAIDSTDLSVKNLLGDDTLSEDGHRALEILQKDWQRAFASLQIKAFDAVGQKFDPFVHDAISEVETDDIEPGICVRQVCRGYLLEHRLLRSAQVVVSKAPAKADSE